MTPVENAGFQRDLASDTINLMIDVPVVPALVFASSCVGSQATDVAGFMTRVITTPNGDLIADQIVTTARATRRDCRANRRLGADLAVGRIRGRPVTMKLAKLLP